MSKDDKWRREAARKLAAPIERKRDLDSVIGRVEDRFEAIMDARRRRMPWAQIAAAVENGDIVSVDAVESAFKRVCRERSIDMAVRRQMPKEPGSAVDDNPAPSSTEQANLFEKRQERWIDDGE